jgi:SAM-dependent methyltransferase
MTDIKEAVREKYGQAALRAGSCCGPASTSPITSNLYTDLETGVLPEAAVLASLGCGNPTALAELKPGETVLDLGSGGGIDVLLSARRVGPGGKAYGLDATPEMVELARANATAAGAGNVEFLQGSIEDIPLSGGHVDVVISNCVINLSADKPRVLAEAFRVLRPGGTFLGSDSLPSDGLHQFHEGDTYNPVEPAAFLTRLQVAGFGEITLRVGHNLIFTARKDRADRDC